jgi:hypothetical protein
MDFELESYDLNVLKNSLKTYQIKILDELMSKYDTEKAIEIYLSAHGPMNTVPFGGDSSCADTQPFLKRFKDEFDKFVCGHPDYEQFYPKVKATSANYSNIIIASISSAIGAKLGLSAAIISPVVVLSLSLLGTMGRKAYCANKGYLMDSSKKEGTQKDT